MLPRSSDSKSQGNKLVFVDVSDPNADQINIRKLVRSSATAYSHRDPTRKQKSRRSDTRKRSSVSRNSSSADNDPSDRSQTLKYETLFNISSIYGPAKYTSSHRRDSRLVLIQEMNSTPQAYLNGGSSDPFCTLPVSSEPWFHWVLDYYRNIQLPPGMAIIQSSDAEGRDYINWHLRESMSEPCLFYMQLLNACTPLVVQGRISQRAVIWLRCMVVSTLNKAISDARTAASTPVLLAVSSIAIHERLYGDKALALDVHGRAFRTMLAMRGGLHALQVPRICHRLLIWTQDILNSENTDKSTEDLLAAWAPEDLRSRHPGYITNDNN